MFPAWRSSGARSTKNDFQSSLSAAGPGRPAAGDCPGAAVAAGEPAAGDSDGCWAKTDPGATDVTRASARAPRMRRFMAAGSPSVRGSRTGPVPETPRRLAVQLLLQRVEPLDQVVVLGLDVADAELGEVRGRCHVSRLIGSGQRLCPLARHRHVDVGLEVAVLVGVLDRDRRVAQLDEHVEIGLEAVALDGHRLPARAGRWRDEDRRRLDGLSPRERDLLVRRAELTQARVGPDHVGLVAAGPDREVVADEAAAPGSHGWGSTRSR